MMKIWTDETDAIVLSNYGKVSVDEIVDLVNDKVEEMYSEKYKWWATTSRGGVNYAAARLGVISQDEYKTIIKDEEYRKRLIRRGVRPEDKARLLKDAKCAHCGSTRDLSIDHIISIKNGGDSSLTNLQILCRSCNSKKCSQNIAYHGEFAFVITDDKVELIREKRRTT
jgi:5-methylcytosine-specific restriction endonuclease McrA